VQNGDSPGYNEQDFMAMAEQLRIVVSKHNDNL
jgi:hypothetical protein